MKTIWKLVSSGEEGLTMAHGNGFACLELDALGDELDFEDEEIPSYLQEDTVDLPKAAETDPSKKVMHNTHNHDAYSPSTLY